jgi:hypothetical protein|eukprot:COSAG02_NODE_1018_length_15181_cov_18.026389_9_plen_87_part_00
MKNLSHKSGLRMRDDVQTNQLKCLDMEGKIARHAQQRQELEDQVTPRNTDGQRGATLCWIFVLTQTDTVFDGDVAVLQFLAGRYQA